MAKTKTKHKRSRVSKDQERANAEKGSQGGSSWFALPEGVSNWAPESRGRYVIDVLPYEVKGKAHPDDIEPGQLWYKLPFSVHHGVGASNDSIVCPASIGKRCPICEERNRLYKED